MNTQPALRIRFDGPPSHESGRFVECEDITGKPVNAGEWSQDGDYWLLTVRSIPGAAPESPSVDLSGPRGCAVADAALKVYREKVDAWAKREKEHVDRLLAESARLASAYSTGLDGDTVRLARETVYLRPPGRNRSYEDRTFIPEPLNSIQTGIVRRFMAILASGTGHPDIRREYMGTKSYDRWECQEEGHAYGYGPAHGHTTMAIGLRDAWQTHGQKAPAPIPAPNIDAALRVLTAILDGKAPVDLLNA